MNMQRKYVYLVVSLLIIAVVLFQEQQKTGNDLKYQEPVDEIKLSDNYVSIEEETTFIINNYQNDDLEKEYTYELTIEGVSGAYEYETKKPTSDTKSKSNYLIFTANGHATFTLKSNETITINGLPKDKTYTLIQNNKYDNYTISINDEIKNQTSGITGIKTEVTVKNNTAKPIPSEPENQEEEQKETKKQNKDKGPNTAVLSSIVLIGVIVSFAIGYLLTKIKIKRFE